MATATVSTVSTEPLVLENVGWETYERLVENCQRQPGLRLTYDDGRLS
jgi:hypothetical protein